MSAYGQRIDANTVRFERTLPGPIERVWAYLTEGDKRAQWFCGGSTVTGKGDALDMLFDHRKLCSETPPPKYAEMNKEMHMSGEISRWAPPHVFGFLWHEPDAPPSEVVIELTPQGDQVHLTLTHSRLADRNAVLSVSGGWHAHLDLLVDVLSNRDRGAFWSRIVPLEQDYDQRYG